MTGLNRRAMLAGAAAVGTTLGAGTANAATRTTYYGALNENQTVANCAGLAQEITRIEDEIALLSQAPDGDIENHYRKLSEALNAKSGALALAIAATETAATSNAANIQENVLKAIVAANDLLLAIAVQTRNPEFIGCAAGVHVLVGTGVFAFQTISVQDQAAVGGAVATLWKGRKTMVTILTTQPGRELAKKQAKMVSELATSAYRIATGSANAAELKAEMEAHHEQLRALDASVAGLPGNIAQTRTFLINRLAAERALYAVLQSGGNGVCQDPNPQIITPLPGQTLP
ncbi:hypothetical protein E2976_20805 [Paracoccus yeei]|uniref:hypothetical protein n=1 Tax=Paracoccus yeei TaxID=147645 RepID=UPI003BF7A692